MHSLETIIIRNAQAAGRAAAHADNDGDDRQATEIHRIASYEESETFNLFAAAYLNARKEG